MLFTGLILSREREVVSSWRRGARPGQHVTKWGQFYKDDATNKFPFSTPLFESSLMTIPDLVSSKTHLWPTHPGTSPYVLLPSSLLVSVLPLAISLLI